MHVYKRFLFVILSSLFSCIAYAQYVTVRSIELYGLKHTREHIVYRELTFQTGDSILQSEIGNVIERNRHNLLNMALFNEVEINISEWDTETDEIDVIIEVSES